LSEIMGPGVGIECMEKNGLHIFEDHFIAEIINPVTGESLPYGQKGELVFTSITKEGLPVVRYRTRDLSCLHAEQCSCGRTHIRMERVSARSDDMLIIRGVNVFPSQIESVLTRFGGTTPHYHLIVDRLGNLDTLEVQVEVSEGMFSDKIRGLEQLGGKIRSEIESTLGVSCKVTLVEPKTLARSEGKAKRVTDRRKL
jgi:phenylacetate-CoA ligase